MIRLDKTTSQMLYQNFVAEMEKLKGKAFLVEGKEVTLKLEMLLSDKVKELVVYQTSLINRFIPKTFFNDSSISVEWLPAIRPSDFSEENYHQKMTKVDAGLVAADYLIADSGTIVLFEENHQAKLVTLLPPTLIVLATTQQLIPDLFAFTRVLQRKNFPTFLYLTGPSRTSDIEKKVVLGVHGPRELYMLVISEG